MTRILGIDPGSQRTGIGIIDSDDTGRLQHVHHQTLQLLAADNFPQRLKLLGQQLNALISQWNIQEVAIERIFMAKNADSALKLGQARGAALCVVALRDLPVSEYAATEVKLALVGRGRAGKQQVQHMVGLLLNLRGTLQADAADALAVALTHAHTQASARRLSMSIATQQTWSQTNKNKLN